MGVYGLLVRQGVDRHTRFQALLNLLCTIYMVVLVIAVTGFSYFHIVPVCYKERPPVVVVHRISILYCLLGCISHYITCVWTDPNVPLQSKQGVEETELNNHTSAETRTRGTETDQSSSSTCDKQRNKSTLENGSKRKRVTSVHKQSGSDVNGQTESRRGHVDFYCVKCKHYIPARVHHCYLCERCIEKRDHHCFFMAVCIGQNNQKYFIFFTLFMGMGTLYGLALIAKYLHSIYSLQFFGPQTFVTLFVQTVLNVFTGRLPTADYLLFFFLMYASLFGTMFAFSFFCWQIMIVYYGQTTYEAKQGIYQYSKETVRENFADVFGDSCMKCFCSLFIPFVDILINR